MCARNVCDDRVLSHARLAAANIDPASGLATDYLNLFNEALMLIGLVAAAPELMGELTAWRPATYRAHFASSAFQHRDVVIAAYDGADPKWRAAFDAAAADLCACVQASIVRLRALNAAGASLRVAAEEASRALRAGVVRLGAMIHGAGGERSSQEAIDALFD